MSQWVVRHKSVKYGECLVSPCHSKESAEEYVRELTANPPEKYRADFEKYGTETFSVAEIPDKDCWWDDPFLCN